MSRSNLLVLSTDFSRNYLKNTITMNPLVILPLLHVNFSLKKTFNCKILERQTCSR